MVWTVYSTKLQWEMKFFVKVGDRLEWKTVNLFLCGVFEEKVLRRETDFCERNDELEQWATESW